MLVLLPFLLFFIGAYSKITFHPHLFSDSMILQRGVSTKVWGMSAIAGATITVTAYDEAFVAHAKGVANSDGTWIVSLPKIPAKASLTLKATDGQDSISLVDVAFGDVLLCGGQSNMGFGMCGAKSKDQTPQQTLDALPKSPNELRFFKQAGSGPGSKCNTSSGKPSRTPNTKWFKANASNSGSASAVCMLSAQYLSEHLPGVPVGAVESCIGGTPIEPWTPPNGQLWKENMVPLLPMTFHAALWDQGEADAKHTNSTWYAHEFPNMITGWRKAFETESPPLPFIYVELCTEYGAKEPKENDFWMAMRAALKLPATGFTTTTDIQRALHPPDKQDVARRLVLEIQRLANGEHVVSRGPELVSSHVTGETLTLIFSNSSMSVHAGIYVGDNATCIADKNNTVVTEIIGNKVTPLAYTLKGNTMTIKCSPGNVSLNAGDATCFLYGPTGLPAPPIEVFCG